MKKIKVVQIGTEHDHAGVAMLSLRKLDDIFEVVGYATPDTTDTHLEAWQSAYAGLRHMTMEEVWAEPGLEAAVIETNEKLLTKYATEAARHGLHVQMDKPGGDVLADFETLIQTVKEKNLTFHTGYMYRYNPAVQKAMEIVKSGELGKVYSVETHMDCIHPKEKREWLGMYQGGMLFFLGCHLVDLTVLLQGVPDEIIPLNTSTLKDGVTAEDLGFVVFKYPNGVSFMKTCAAEPGGFLRRQLVICCEKGTIELEPIEYYADMEHPGSELCADMRVINDVDGAPWNARAEAVTYGPFDRYDNMLRSFAQIVRGEKENPWSYDYELQLYKIVLAACGQKVDYKK